MRKKTRKVSKQDSEQRENSVRILRSFSFGKQGKREFVQNQVCVVVKL